MPGPASPNLSPALPMAAAPAPRFSAKPLPLQAAPQKPSPSSFHTFFNIDLHASNIKTTWTHSWPSGSRVRWPAQQRTCTACPAACPGRQSPTAVAAACRAWHGRRCPPAHVGKPGKQFGNQRAVAATGGGTRLDALRGRGAGAQGAGRSLPGGAGQTPPPTCHPLVPCPACLVVHVCRCGAAQVKDVAAGKGGWGRVCGGEGGCQGGTQHVLRRLSATAAIKGVHVCRWLGVEQQSTPGAAAFKPPKADRAGHRRSGRRQPTQQTRHESRRPSGPAAARASEQDGAGAGQGGSSRKGTQAVHPPLCRPGRKVDQVAEQAGAPLAAAQDACLLGVLVQLSTHVAQQAQRTAVLLGLDLPKDVSEPCRTQGLLPAAGRRSGYHNVGPWKSICASALLQHTFHIGCKDRHANRRLQRLQHAPSYHMAV